MGVQGGMLALFNIFGDREDAIKREERKTREQKPVCQDCKHQFCCAYYVDRSEGRFEYKYPKEQRKLGVPDQEFAGFFWSFCGHCDNPESKGKAKTQQTEGTLQRRFCCKC